MPSTIPRNRRLEAISFDLWVRCADAVLPALDSRPTGGGPDAPQPDAVLSALLEAARDQPGTERTRTLMLAVVAFLQAREWPTSPAPRPSREGLVSLAYSRLADLLCLLDRLPEASEVLGQARSLLRTVPSYEELAREVYRSTHSRLARRRATTTQPIEHHLRP